MTTMVRQKAPTEPQSWPVHTAPVVADHLQEQGWERLADGTIHFDDEGEIEPDGHTVPAHSNEPPHARLWDSDLPPVGGAR